MSFFNLRGDTLHAEDVSLASIAEQIGTPCYVYSRAELEQNWRMLNEAFASHPTTICYAVKANSNLAVLNILARLGSGFDIVSGGEFKRVILAGGDPQKTVYSGVAKSVEELKLVIENDIRCINVESLAELERVQEVAKRVGKTANIAVRVNPDIDAQTHPYIATGLEQSKFGVTMGDALEAYQRATTMPNIRVFGMACHIGSQITKLEPFKDAVQRVLALVGQLGAEGIELQQLDLGGGLGIQYRDEQPPSAVDYANTLLSEMASAGVNLPLEIEPGRFIAGNAGVLLTRVEYLKHNASKDFAVVDAGMNDLLRPSLYQAHHDIVNVRPSNDHPERIYDVVGPVCESSDVLGADRALQIEANDLLAVKSAGAYSFSMASNYNSRPRPPEIMVDGGEVHIIRCRETLDELTSGEALLP